MDVTGQKARSPDGPNPTTSPLTPFFCLVNVRLMKSGWIRPWLISVFARGRELRNNWVSLRQNGDASGDSVAAYSPGRRRKKKPMTMRSAMAWWNGVFW